MTTPDDFDDFDSLDRRYCDSGGYTLYSYGPGLAGATQTIPRAVPRCRQLATVEYRPQGAPSDWWLGRCDEHAKRLAPEIETRPAGGAA